MHLVFDDFESYREAAAGWGLEFTQLDRGPFRGTLRQVSGAKVSITHFDLNRQFYQRGEIRGPGRTFAIFLNRISPMRWQNSSLVDADTLVIFPADGALDALTFPGFDAVSISVDQAFLAATSQRNDLEWSCEAIPDHAVNFQTDPHVIAALRISVRKLLEMPGHGVGHADRRQVESDIALLILKALAVHLPKASLASDRKRDRAFAAALEVIDGSTLPPALPDLSRMVGASERTLRYVFRERLGVSPRHYINAQRLKRVRESLLSSPTGRAPIQDIAAQFGYWHSGQFAADYHDMFGERPSETLLRNGRPYGQ